MGRVFAFLVTVGGLALALAWGFGLPPFATPPPTPRSGEGLDPGKVAEKLKLGGPLYGDHSIPDVPPRPVRPGREPVVIYANLVAVERMDACAQVPGQILFIGDEVPEAAAQLAGVGIFTQGKYYAASVNQGDREFQKIYRRLTEGETVDERGMVALIDAAKAIHGVNEKNAKLKAAIAEADSAEKIDKEAENRLRIELQIHGSKGGLELSNAVLTRVKTHGEYVAKREAVKLAEIDLIQSEIILRQHEVRNRLPVKKAIIKSVLKHRGETVKDSEPIVHLYAIDRLMAEGLVELQNATQLTLGQAAIVEPSREISPLRVWRSHKKEVTAVAVSPDGIVASASEDGTVCLWHMKYDGAMHLLRHGQPVRSLACSPKGAAHKLCLAGLADGTIAVWNLEMLKEGELPKPAKLLKTAHSDSVTALAFSPDGKTFASGSADGSIELWSPEHLSAPSEGRVYAFDSAHGVDQPHSGPVTSLHFTPQGRLVSAARDNTLRVWSLHEKGAVLAVEPMAGRGGNVGQLGVTRDGRYMLFDQGKTLHLVGHDGRTIVTIQNPSTGNTFDTLALFSPDASMMLTAGAAEGRLQLWRSPVGGERAYELSQYVTSERATVTSAAFFEANGEAESYAVSGAKDGNVYLWPVASRRETGAHRIAEVRLTQISRNVETRQVRVGVEVHNPDGKLIPGQPVTIVIE